jgi:hypothetical protein
MSNWPLKPIIKGKRRELRRNANKKWEVIVFVVLGFCK